mgnify:FL=1
MPWQEFEIKDFSEGLIDKVDDDLLPENAAADVQNFIGTKIGSLKKRAGQKRLNNTELGGFIQGLYAYYYSNQRRLVAVANGTAYYWDGSDFVELKTGLHPTAMAQFTTTANYMVCFNGINPPWKWDGIEVSELANAPSKGRFALFHKGKLFTVDADTPSILRWSNSFQPETWEEVNYWEVKAGDGDEITCLRKHLDTLVIFKKHSLHVLSGTNLDDFRMEELDEKTGCVGPNAAVIDSAKLYFVSENGLYVWNGMQVKNLSQERIPHLWERINKPYLHKAAVTTWNGLIWFALPEGSSTYNNLVIVYDPNGGRFWIFRGINASCFEVFNDGVRRKLLAGDSVAGFVNEQDTETDDFGEPIEAYWEGKSLAVGIADRKNLFSWAVLQDMPGANGVELEVSIDYGEFNSLLPGDEDDLVRRFDFYTEYEGRYLKPKLYHNLLGGCEVRGLKIYFRPFVGVL